MNLGQITSQMSGMPNLKVDTANVKGGTNFGDMLKGSLTSLESTQVASQNSMQRLLTTGEGNAHEVIIAMNAAESQIKMASVVRDKLVENYQQIMNMQI